MTMHFIDISDDAANIIEGGDSPNPALKDLLALLSWLSIF